MFNKNIQVQNVTFIPIYKERKQKSKLADIQTDRDVDVTGVVVIIALTCFHLTFIG